jgi:hypothetical protein
MLILVSFPADGAFEFGLWPAVKSAETAHSTGEAGFGEASADTLADHRTGHSRVNPGEYRPELPWHAFASRRADVISLLPPLRLAVSFHA